jgi:HSP20 family protein
MLVRFDPFRELDRLWDAANAAASGPRSMPMNVVRRGDQLVLTFDLPGVPLEAVDLTVERDQLTVSAERSQARREGEEWLVNERPTGRYHRQLLLGDNLDTDRIDANLHDGVLEITIPVAEQAKPRKVAIGGGTNGAQPEAIEATSN